MEEILFDQLLQLIKREYASKNFYKIFDKNTIRAKLKKLTNEQAKDILYTKNIYTKDKGLQYIKLCLYLQDKKLDEDEELFFEQNIHRINILNDEFASVLQRDDSKDIIKVILSSKKDYQVEFAYKAATNGYTLAHNDVLKLIGVVANVDDMSRARETLSVVTNSKLLECPNLMDFISLLKDVDEAYVGKYNYIATVAVHFFEPEEALKIVRNITCLDLYEKFEPSSGKFNRPDAIEFVETVANSLLFSTKYACETAINDKVLQHSDALEFTRIMSQNMMFSPKLAYYTVIDDEFLAHKDAKAILEVVSNSYMEAEKYACCAAANEMILQNPYALDIIRKIAESEDEEVAKQLYNAYSSNRSGATDSAQNVLKKTIIPKDNG